MERIRTSDSKRPSLNRCADISTEEQSIGSARRPQAKFGSSGNFGIEQGALWAPDITDRALTPRTKRRNKQGACGVGAPELHHHSIAHRSLPRGACQWGQRSVSGLRDHSSSQTDTNSRYSRMNPNLA